MNRLLSGVLLLAVLALVAARPATVPTKPLVGEWGPFVDGLSSRVLLDRPVAEGDPLTVTVEFRATDAVSREFHLGTRVVLKATLRDVATGETYETTELPVGGGVNFHFAQPLRERPLAAIGRPLKMMTGQGDVIAPGRYEVRVVYSNREELGNQGRSILERRRQVVGQVPVWTGTVESGPLEFEIVPVVNNTHDVPVPVGIELAMPEDESFLSWRWSDGPADTVTVSTRPGYHLRHWTDLEITVAGDSIPMFGDSDSCLVPMRYFTGFGGSADYDFRSRASGNIFGGACMPAHVRERGPLRVRAYVQFLEVPSDGRRGPQKSDDPLWRKTYEAVWDPAHAARPEVIAPPWEPIGHRQPSR